MMIIVVVLGDTGNNELVFVFMIILISNLGEWLVSGGVNPSLSQLLLEGRVPEILYLIVSPSW